VARNDARTVYIFKKYLAVNNVSDKNIFQELTTWPP